MKLVNIEKPKRGRPKTNLKPITKTSEIGTKPGETRATFIVNIEQLEQVKALAHWDRTSIKEVLSSALTHYFNSKGKELAKAMELYQGKAKNLNVLLSDLVSYISQYQVGLEKGDKKIESPDEFVESVSRKLIEILR